jgi:hypothetical protein
MNSLTRRRFGVLLLAAAGPTVLGLTAVAVASLFLEDASIMGLLAGIGLAALYVCGAGIAIGYQISRRGSFMRRWFAGLEVALLLGVVLFTVAVGVAIPEVVEVGGWADMMWAFVVWGFWIHVAGLGVGAAFRRFL